MPAKGNQRVFDHLYDLVFFSLKKCDQCQKDLPNGESLCKACPMREVPPGRCAELLDWLWRRMEYRYRNQPPPHRARDLKYDKKGAQLLLGLRGSDGKLWLHPTQRGRERQLLLEHDAYEGDRKSRKYYLMKQFGFPSDDALRKAIKRANSGHPGRTFSVCVFVQSVRTGLRRCGILLDDESGQSSPNPATKRSAAGQ
jgi:hypothetical protein